MAPSNETVATPSLFEEVVRTSGLAVLIANAAVTRACTRAGVEPRRLDRSSLGRVLPFLEMTLKLYLPDEAEHRMRALESLAR